MCTHDSNPLIGCCWQKALITCLHNVSSYVNPAQLPLLLYHKSSSTHEYAYLLILLTPLPTRRKKTTCPPPNPCNLNQARHSSLPPAPPPRAALPARPDARCPPRTLCRMLMWVFCWGCWGLLFVGPKLQDWRGLQLDVRSLLAVRN